MNRAGGWIPAKSIGDVVDAVAVGFLDDIDDPDI